MSPSRAGSSHSSSWRVFSSARDLFHFSSKWKSAKNEPKIGWKWAKIQFLFFIKNLYWKWLNYAAQLYNSALKKPHLLINDYEIDYNHVIKAKSWGKNELLRFFDIHIVGIVSSVSARKSRCPSSARLGSETSQLGLARAGKFQLELISSI